jgi:hypothetical protein
MPRAHRGLLEQKPAIRLGLDGRLVGELEGAVTLIRRPVPQRFGKPRRYADAG